MRRWPDGDVSRTFEWYEEDKNVGYAITYYHDKTGRITDAGLSTIWFEADPAGKTRLHVLNAG